MVTANSRHLGALKANQCLAIASTLAWVKATLLLWRPSVIEKLWMMVVQGPATRDQQCSAVCSTVCSAVCCVPGILSELWPVHWDPCGQLDKELLILAAWIFLIPQWRFLSFFFLYFSWCPLPSKSELKVQRWGTSASVFLFKQESCLSVHCLNSGSFPFFGGICHALDPMCGTFYTI